MPYNPCGRVKQRLRGINHIGIGSNRSRRLKKRIQRNHQQADGDDESDYVAQLFHNKRTTTKITIKSIHPLRKMTEKLSERAYLLNKRVVWVRERSSGGGYDKCRARQESFVSNHIDFFCTFLNDVLWFWQMV